MPKTIRELIINFLNKEDEGYTLVELYGDDLLLNELTNSDSIIGLNDLYTASAGKVSKVFINQEDKIVRVK